MPLPPKRTSNQYSPNDRHRSAEPDEGDGEAAPDDVEAGAAMKDGLGEVAVSGRGENLLRGSASRGYIRLRTDCPVASCRPACFALRRGSLILRPLSARAHFH